MSDNTNLVRLGGWSGIAVILLFVVALFLFPGTAVELWLAILASLLTVPFFIGVYFILRDSGNETLFPTAFGLIGVAFLVLAYLVNAEFHYWYQERIAAASGAEAAGARLILAASVYPYGKVDRPMTEDMPDNPAEPTGVLHAKGVQMALDAHEKGRVRVAVGRSSNYFGPNAGRSYAGDGIFYNALSGDPAMVIGDVNTRHTYTYVDDFANGLVTLSTHDEALGQIWHVPSAPTITTRQLIDMAFSGAGRPASVLGDINAPHTYAFVDDVARGLITLAESEQALGQVWHIPAAPTLSHRELLTIVFEQAGKPPKIRGSRVSGFFVKLIGRFQPAVGDVAEISYQFDKPLVVDPTKYERAFGASPTPHRDALRQTLAWYKANPLPA